MKSRRKFLLFALGAAGLLVVILSSIVFFVPRLVNVAAVKSRVLSELERRAGVRLSFDRAEIVFFPRPRLSLEGVSLSVPGWVEGTVKRLEADISPLALLRNRIPIGSLLAVAPAIRVRIPEREKKEKPLSLEEIEGKVSSLLAQLGTHAPSRTITVRDGRLDLFLGERPLLSLHDLQAGVVFPPDRLTVRIRCASGYWEALSIETSVRPEGLRAETRIETAGLRVRELAERLSPEAATPWLGETVLSLRGRIESEGVRSAKAEISGTMPILTIRRESRSRVVRVSAFKGALDLDDRGIHATLSDLALDEPRMRLSGVLAVDQVSPRIEVSLTGQGMEIGPVRDTLLALAGDVPTVRDILDVVRGGAIPRFSVQSSGRSPGELGGLDALRFQASLSGGSIHIPGPNLELEEVRVRGGDGQGSPRGKGDRRAVGKGSRERGFAPDRICGGRPSVPRGVPGGCGRRGTSPPSSSPRAEPGPSTTSWIGSMRFGGRRPGR